MSLTNITDVIEKLEMDILPYIVLLIVPVLGRMTDQHEHVRTVATHCFASLIRLLPLEVCMLMKLFIIFLYRKY